MIPKILYDLTTFSNNYQSFYHILKQSADAEGRSIDEMKLIGADDEIDFMW